MFKVVITDHTFISVEPEKKVLQGLAEVVDLNGAPMKTEEDVITACQGANALIIGFAPITARVLDALHGLRCVVRYGIGVDTIDLKAAEERGIWVANVPDYCISEVADHTLALLLSLSRKVLLLDKDLRAGNWRGVKISHPIHRLADQVLGIVGLGRIGREVAARARGFGYTILGYDPYIDEQTAETFGIHLVDFQNLISTVDVLTLHLPLNSETRGLINAATIGRMKPTAILINTCRGAIVDTNALAEALQTGRITGAALDVFETEPLPRDHPILRAPNTILQPHVAWYSEESLLELQRNAAEEVARVLQGEPPKNPVTKVQGK
jgi:D-3-phosphoglycerate dehydrogenase